MSRVAWWFCWALLCTATAATGQEGGFRWPHGAQAAVSLTYDDGEVYEWLWPEFAQETYTVRRMAEEVRIANLLFRAIDGQAERTFAYPCNDCVSGGESYVDAIRPLVPAARAGGGRIVTDLRALDLHQVPCHSFADRGGQTLAPERMIAVVDVALQSGGLAVICFHGGGGGHSSNLSREAHQQLIRYLDENRGRIWTDTFLAVMKHLRAERQRLGWETPGAADGRR